MHSSRADSTVRPPDPDQLMADADRVCAEKGLTFTPLRREVFELVCRHLNPVGAYELLDELKSTRESAAPVTVYRALDFLVSAGLVHRVAALNAFTACHGHGPGHGGLLLICGNCSNVVELEDERVAQAIALCAGEARFDAAREPIEVRGLCRECRGNEAE